MTLTDTSRTTGLARPAWMLILSLPTFVAYLALAVLTIAQGAESSSAELTPAQISDLGLWWVAVHLLWIAPSVLAALGLAAVARVLDLPHAGTVRLLAAGVLALSGAYVVVQLMAFRHGGPTWGDGSLFSAGVVLSLVAGWIGTIPATILVARDLARRGIMRKTAWTVTALMALYLVVELLTYLPALLGSASLKDTVGLPPFLLGIFWAILGGGLLRARVPSGP